MDHQELADIANEAIDEGLNDEATLKIKLLASIAFYAKTTAEILDKDQFWVARRHGFIRGLEAADKAVCEVQDAADSKPREVHVALNSVKASLQNLIESAGELMSEEDAQPK